MVTKKFVSGSVDESAAASQENVQLADWLGKTRNRLERGQREFYENIGVKQQTGDNYESGKTPIPAWVVVRAVQHYGNAEDLRWWMNLTVEAPAATKDMVVEAVANLSVEQLNKWAHGAVGYETLSPDRAQRLHQFIENAVLLFARGLVDAENHLVNQVRVINELAASATTPMESSEHRNNRAKNPRPVRAHSKSTGGSKER